MPNAWTKRWVLTFFLKVSTEGLVRIDSGNKFQRWGDEKEKPRSPKTEFTFFATRELDPLERRHREGSYMEIRSDKYAGAKLFSDL